MRVVGGVNGEVIIYRPLYGVCPIGVWRMCRAGRDMRAGDV